MNNLTISWLSAGVSSFIATWLAKDKIDEMYYIDILDQHSDSMRFIKDCEKVLCKEIKILKSPLESVENACLSGGYIRQAKTINWCTKLLKQRVRKEQFELLHKNDEITYVWGFDCNEKDRAERLYQSMSNYNHIFPLIDNNLSKDDCHAICRELSVKRPLMYDLGYNNNNCIGCVKGGMGYWNKIRVDFPEVFKQRADLERKLNSRCLKECFLDELDPSRGNQSEEVMEECGIFCELALRKSKGENLCGKQSRF